MCPRDETGIVDGRQAQGIAPAEKWRYIGVAGGWWALGVAPAGLQGWRGHQREALRASRP